MSQPLIFLDAIHFITYPQSFREWQVLFWCVTALFAINPYCYRVIFLTTQLVFRTPIIQFGSKWNLSQRAQVKVIIPFVIFIQCVTSLVILYIVTLELQSRVTSKLLSIIFGSAQTLLCKKWRCGENPYNSVYGNTLYGTKIIDLFLNLKHLWTS